MRIKNSDQFDDVVNSVFAALLEAFPRTITLRPEVVGVSGSAELSQENVGFSGNARPKLTAEETFFSASVSWLIGEGLITGSGGTNATFIGVVLTGKGLLAVNATPHCLQPNLHI
ncbi:hypothetical protein [Pseudomonas sp. NPDC089734]|uniref:hypothetical protein n=1 Tax=Pseudomonas sp. NPDC089734 TaxID=3364469 RepID=UPI003810EB40